MSLRIKAVGPVTDVAAQWALGSVVVTKANRTVERTFPLRCKG